MTKMHEISLKETVLNFEVTVQYFLKSDKVEELFIYVPCFNYKKETIKYFYDCFENKNCAFVSFDYESFHKYELELTPENISKNIESIVRWVIQNFPQTKIYLLAESWACGPALEYFKKNNHKLDKLILWNFPSGSEYQRILKWYKPKNTMEVKAFEKKYIFINGYWYEKEILNLSTDKYVEKLLTFNLLKVNDQFKGYFRKSEKMFKKYWTYLLNTEHMNKIHLIESKNNYLHSNYVKEFYGMWKNNISFIEGHHFLITNLFENKNLFKELERIVYGNKKA